MLELYLTLFCMLVAAHFLADYPLQNEFMAIYKSRHAKHPHLGAKEPHLWLHLLTAHAAIHGGLVLLITNNVWLGLLEFALHWLIDLAKNDHYTHLDQDQALHLMCKLVYVGLVVFLVCDPPWWFSL